MYIKKMHDYAIILVKLSQDTDQNRQSDYLWTIFLYYFLMKKNNADTKKWLDKYLASSAPGELSIR